MGLFSRRPLCFFAMLFLVSAVFSFNVSWQLSLILFIIFLIASAVFIILSLRIRKHHVRFMTVFLSTLSVALALLHSLLFIHVPENISRSYIGERKVSCYILDDEQVSDGVEDYTVKIKSIDGKNTNIKAYLSTEFSLDLNSGDEIYGIATLKENSNAYTKSDGRLLVVYMDDPQNCFIRHTSERPIHELVFADGGIEIATERVADAIKVKLNSLLGEEKGALAMGFFTGEREGISAEITRDFKRTGLSHIMAVSGSHIAILLGSVEILLRLLYVDKKYRCIIVSLLGIVFLFFAGFSASACRSVLMLYAVYISFFAYEDNDSVTSLFISISAIVILSPFAVCDVGMWMSFFATLGLLTAYQAFEEKIPYPKSKNKFLKKLLTFLRDTLLIAVMTVVSNLFLLTIIWMYFGEMSTVSVLGNIIITHPSSLFLISVPVLLLVHGIPIIGGIAASAVSFIADTVLFTVRVLSRIPNATVSIKYTFCTVIVILFTVSMIVLLTVKLKKKYLIVIPMVSAVVAFSVCLAINNIFFVSPSVIYTNNSKNDEIFIVKEGSELSACDNSGGGYYSYSVIRNEINKSHATEISNYVLTHYHKEHLQTLELLSQYYVIRNIHLPIPTDETEAAIASNIRILAERGKIEIFFYERNEGIRMSNGVVMNVSGNSDHEKGSFIAFTSEYTDVVYTTPYLYNREIPYNTVIFGGHGSIGREWYINGLSAKTVIAASEKLYRDMNLQNISNAVIPRREYNYSRAEIPLGKTAGNN